MMSKRMSWEDVCHWLAQAAVNITEGKHHTFEAGSRVHRALEEFCQLANEGLVPVKQRWHRTADGYRGPDGLEIRRERRIGRTSRFRFVVYLDGVEQLEHFVLREAKRKGIALVTAPGTAPDRCEAGR